MKIERRGVTINLRRGMGSAWRALSLYTTGVMNNLLMFQWVSHGTQKYLQEITLTIMPSSQEPAAPEHHLALPKWLRNLLLADGINPSRLNPALGQNHFRRDHRQRQHGVENRKSKEE